MKQWPGFPQQDEIHLWIGTDLLSASMDSAMDFLAPEEQERSQRFRFETDRRRYVGGTLLQRLILAQYVSCSVGALSFSRNQWGKPSLDRRHDSTIEFSLSRSHQVALLAVTTESKVGADLEYARGRNSRDLSIKSQFSEAEQDFIDSTPDSTQSLFDIWARKEAYIKGIGRGLSHPLAEFDVTPEAPAGERIVRDWSDDSPDESWRVRSVKLPVDGYAASIATTLPSPSIKLIEVSRDELLAQLSGEG